MLNGVDISNHQVTVPEGYDFYILKASEGNGFKDGRLDSHYNTLVSRGVKNYGFYHYARPDLGNTPQAEADWFLYLVGHHAGKCIYALDLEGEALRYSDYANWAKQWLDYVYAKTGVKPLLYIQGSIASVMYGVIGGNDYGIWAASSANWYHMFPFIVMQQSVYNNLDHDTFYGTQETWDKYCAKYTEPDTPPSSNPSQVSGSTLELAYGVMTGEFDNGEARKAKLGDRYQEVQDFINHIYSASIDTLVDETLNGTYGNGNIRKVVLGDRYEAVQTIINSMAHSNRMYTIHAGDTLSAIAIKYGTTLDNILKLNPWVTNPDYIQTGWTIRV